MQGLSRWEGFCQSIQCLSRYDGFVKVGSTPRPRALIGGTFLFNSIEKEELFSQTSAACSKAVWLILLPSSSSKEVQFRKLHYWGFSCAKIEML